MGERKGGGRERGGWGDKKGEVDWGPLLIRNHNVAHIGGTAPADFERGARNIALRSCCRVWCNSSGQIGRRVLAKCHDHHQ